MVDEAALDRYHAKIKGDNEWQQRARLLQSLWRERRALEPAPHGGGRLGSSLTPDDGGPPYLAGFLSRAAKEQVQAAVDDARHSGALLQRPRLWENLLSSQPLCFNLFGPLACDLVLATAALRLVWPRIGRVTAIRFEWSPGRGDPHYTGNRSAFDVFVEYEGVGGRGFLGIEVKYHEDLTGTPASDPGGRYPDIASRHGAFRDDALPALQELPLQQIWLDHLLALQLLASDRDPYTEGMRDHIEQLNRPMFVNDLATSWLPAVPELHIRLRADPPARVAEIACGAGWASIALARSYPKVRVDGFDLDAASIERATRNAAAAGVDDRVSFAVRDAADPALGGGYHVVMVFEALHDLARPVQALAAARALLADGGCVIVGDERVAERFTAPGDEVERLMYGFSILHCLPASRTESPSAATGTALRPATLRAYATEAGFSEVQVLPIENEMWRFYRLAGQTGSARR